MRGDKSRLLCSPLLQSRFPDFWGYSAWRKQRTHRGKWVLVRVMWTNTFNELPK